MRTLSPAANASIMAEETDEVWLVLLQIDHDDLAAPIRVANNTENVVSGGETYVGLPFELALPAESDNGPGEAVIRVDNVDRQIVEAVRTITSPPRVTIRVVLASQPDVIEALIENMVMKDVTYDVATVQGRLRFEDIVTEPVAETITPERFPGLF